MESPIKSLKDLTMDIVGKALDKIEQKKSMGNTSFCFSLDSRMPPTIWENGHRVPAPFDDGRDQEPEAVLDWP